jgi:hypothetical protein
VDGRSIPADVKARDDQELAKLKRHHWLAAATFEQSGEAGRAVVAVGNPMAHRALTTGIVMQLALFGLRPQAVGGRIRLAPGNSGVRSRMPRDK